jgi:putative oxidoreductase
MDASRNSPVTGLDIGLLAVRVALGVMIWAHGAQKLLGWFGGSGPGGFVDAMAGMGIPAFLAWLAIIAEFFGGLGLIFGVLPRLSALGVLIVMIVAAVKVHAQHGFFMNWFGAKQGEGWEFHLLAGAMALLIMLAGPGRVSLPDFEGRLLKKA